MSWPRFWRETRWQTQLLKPLAWWVCSIAQKRLLDFRQAGLSTPPEVSVIVVGNVVVGGSGKTPFISWLTRQLQAHGLRVGIISRGYGGNSRVWPREVTPQSVPKEVGDEPVMLAQQLGVPVVVAPKRKAALEALLAQHSLDVVISDDGLQHYGLPRDLEIVLVDSERLFGNCLCLPAGPLREPLDRLQQVDFLVYNGELNLIQQPARVQGWIQAWDHKSYAMALQPLRLRHLFEASRIQTPQSFAGRTVEALAGIGNPERFFESLRGLGMTVNAHPFADHHAYQPEELLALNPQNPLIMTAKDAVKCSPFLTRNPELAERDWWVLDVQPDVDAALSAQIVARIQAKRSLATLTESTHA
ncbi:tetraacyldisaccharide 4'-kinase [Thiomicrorhabdus cannonii]|uniref:tetraacyldisaccharide 4'-kinase n=1 Tax=Thiomicrorhabdus cannonii TaxID=2748011 RepID=UPI0015BF301B|nr:tetraacyldisaccharide 4'-kinase [Thiomicrorhabdus cannonii]